MGSVKDLITLNKPQDHEPGLGIFQFSNRYSVFDWGEMPNHIPHKGSAICTIGAHFFELLQQYCVSNRNVSGHQIDSHYRGIIAPEGGITSIHQIKTPPQQMLVNLVRVIKLSFQEGHYDYGGYNTENVNYLIPLEIIYRNTIPAGSSVFGRIDRGELTLEELGLNHYPKPGESLPHPFFDWSTKLEQTDRYLSKQEAIRIIHLNSSQWTNMLEILSTVNTLISQEITKLGLQNDDGKIECAIDYKGDVILVDVIGAPDECRFSRGTTPISKEIARDYYRTTPWYQDVIAAKQKAKEMGRKDWKSLCSSAPDPLPKELLEIISQMYMSTANGLIERQLFNSPPLTEVIEKYKNWQVQSHQQTPHCP